MPESVNRYTRRVRKHINAARNSVKNLLTVTSYRRDKREQTMNRNKKVRCNLCGRCMRSYILKRRANTHKDILTMPDEETCQKLRRRNAVQMQQEERRQGLMIIAQQ